MGKKRILIIDDDEDILDILQIIFEEEGFEMMRYNTGATAEHVRILHPDLVLMDVRILGFPKNGAEICAELKSNADLQNLPVVLLSAEDGLGIIARECHADSFVSKPFNVKHLVDQVKQLLH